MVCPNCQHEISFAQFSFRNPRSMKCPNCGATIGYENTIKNQLLWWLIIVSNVILSNLIPGFIFAQRSYQYYLAFVGLLFLFGTISNAIVWKFINIKFKVIKLKNTRETKYYNSKFPKF